MVVMLKLPITGSGLVLSASRGFRGHGVPGTSMSKSLSNRPRRPLPWRPRGCGKTPRRPWSSCRTGGAPSVQEIGASRLSSIVPVRRRYGKARRGWAGPQSPRFGDSGAGGRDRSRGSRPWQPTGAAVWGLAAGDQAGRSTTGKSWVLRSRPRWEAANNGHAPGRVRRRPGTPPGGNGNAGVTAVGGGISKIGVMSKICTKIKHFLKRLYVVFWPSGGLQDWTLLPHNLETYGRFAGRGARHAGDAGISREGPGSTSQRGVRIRRSGRQGLGAAAWAQASRGAGRGRTGGRARACSGTGTTPGR